MTARQEIDPATAMELKRRGYTVREVALMMSTPDRKFGVDGIRGAIFRRKKAWAAR